MRNVLPSLAFPSEDVTCLEGMVLAMAFISLEDIVASIKVVAIESWA